MSKKPDFLTIINLFVFLNIEKILRKNCIGMTYFRGDYIKWIAFEGTFQS